MSVHPYEQAWLDQAPEPESGAFAPELEAWAADKTLDHKELEQTLHAIADAINAHVRGMTAEELQAKPRGVQVAGEIASRLRFGKLNPDDKPGKRWRAEPQPCPTPAAPRVGRAERWLAALLGDA